MSELEKNLACVWEGTFFRDDKHLNDLRGEFLQNLESNIDNIESDIRACKNELQRVQRIKKLFQWIPVPQSYFQRFQKSPEISYKLREKANQAYKDGKYNLALRGYNLAVMFASVNGEELGLAYGNRSALFVQMKNPGLALHDIELALSCSYPELLKNKLLDRKKKCNDILLQRRNDNLKTHDYKLNGKKYCQENLLRLKTSNALITNAEDFVTIDYTKEHGRRLLVNKNISAGTVLVFEEPYVHVLANYLTWDTTHCHFCSERILAGIPCTGCTFALYCDEKCRDSAAPSHFFEHNMLAYHHCHESALKDLISTRIIIKAGPQFLFSLFQRQKTLRLKDNTANCDVYFNPDDGTVFGQNESGVYESKSYLPIYHLISHAKCAPLKDTVSNIFRAIVLTYLLRDTSNFFNSLKTQYSVDYPQEQFEEFVGSLLLRHIENINYNAVSISELQAANEDLHTASVFASSSTKLKDCKSISYATGIFSLISLTNHSCDPNAVIAKKAKWQQTALVSVRSLNAGDEIFITYKPQFTNQITKDRQMFLHDRYNFICQCEACLSNWSIDSHANYTKPAAKCAECFKRKSSKACKDCEQVAMNLDFQLENFQIKLYEADDLLQAGDFVQAIRILIETIQFFSKHFTSLFALFQVAQDLYKRALLLMLYSCE